MNFLEVRDSLWKPLELLALPTTAGRRLDVGGFVLGDSFETFLTNISEDYLHTAWTRLSSFLKQHQIEVNDLTWGWMHCGETWFPGVSSSHMMASASPLDFVGWTSCELSKKWPHFEACKLFDDELKMGEPLLRCTMTWRSLKWNIEPQDYQMALRLIEALCFDEPSEWNPENILERVPAPTNLWQRIAQAIHNNNQQHLNNLVEQAKLTYSPLGLRILIRGFRAQIYDGYHYDEHYEDNTTFLKLK